MPIVGTVHSYAFNKVAFEFNGHNPSHSAKNVLLFIGGLTNGLLGVHYLPKLAEKVNTVDHDGDWVLVQGILSSAWSGWGQSSLKTDNEEIGQIVSYLRSENGGNRQKIVLMGHSTGCQDTLRYLCDFSYSKEFDESMEIDGGILQAPVSDREAIQEWYGSEYLEKLVKECYDEYISKGLQEQTLPVKFSKVAFDTPITAYRFYSLYSRYGDDDFFSSYIDDEGFAKTFGKVKKPLLALYGSKDPCAPKDLDIQALVSRWQKVTNPKVWSPLSKVLVGANHEVEDPDACLELIETVSKFISSL
ncbi:hypothetical protein PSN45_003886 [Yamadazyma tenuis]|uniref:DUF1749-domain-containing protein n=1 Tax=Candida tenuis (strain ATCC 10573 / BCRC 21748 / CBS 615 / JCM 9827 / NBRC 10315 / NRRL Y-1498 / VKM Y-70) TaxID=590646 RepID=G3B506_CANTC|nr:DUF1749-domain-containing protein [Yamadazyma tenuis ATCC 10573]EGV64031.1 DUF1749-domain-containing protein [Yamadazyma tenuis ATCC 10573]WEJ96347.1 hypothetical protein PSN45_003886 [Yamadazyma tenuis]